MVDLDTYTGPSRILKRSARLSYLSKGRKEPARAPTKKRRERGGCSKNCTAPGFPLNATFGREGSAGLRGRECCGVYKLPGMVDLAALAESAKLADTGRTRSSLGAKTQTRGTGGSDAGGSGGSGGGTGSID